MAVVTESTMTEAATYWYTRFYFQRALGGIYAVGFLIALNQYRALVGRSGLLPMPLFLKEVSFWDAPGLFWINQSDAFITALASIGLAFSIAAFVGWSDAFGTTVSVGVWFSLWVLYMSFVNAGQTFYGFGWETLLLETGFLAIFMGPTTSKPSVILIILLRWLLFRLMFGAGMIKIRGDECWRDLTCMKYHYETMPLPGPTSWFFNLLPDWFQKSSIVFNHVVELAVPFFYFANRPLRHTAGILTVVFQTIIIISGNFSWLNHITLVIAIACFDDSFFTTFFPSLGLNLGAWTRSMGLTPENMAAATAGSSIGLPSPVIYVLAAVIGVLSIKPALNLFSSRQVMNTSFDPFHIVNTYGAFGSITRVRNEIIIEGSDSLQGPWQEYEFKGKPGSLSRRPPLVSPYHYKLDWQMWFAAMGPYNYNPWILNLVAKILEGDRPVLGLLEKNPFPNHPPQYVRALLFEYHYSRPGENTWWTRKKVDDYLPPLSLKDPAFLQVLESQGWL